MGKKDQRSTPFSLEGRFLGFLVEDGYKLKRLRLMTAVGEREIKLSKEARASVRGVLTPGDWIRVWGEQTINSKTDAVKLKADQISRIAPGQTEPASTVAKSQHFQEASKAAATVLVCQKSDCMKRGGKAVCQALQNGLRDRDLADVVRIQGTGCMKHCKAGPNIVIMPDKARYSRVSAEDIPALLDEHFPCESAQASVSESALQPHQC